MFHLLLHVQVTVFLSEGSEKVYIAGEFCVRSEMKVTQSCPTLCNPTDYTVHGILQARILEWIAFPVSWRSSQPRDQPRSPTLQADSLPAEPQRKPKNTEWVAYPSFSGSSQPRNRTRVLYQLDSLPTEL